MSSVREIASAPVAFDEGIAEFFGDFPLHFGGNLKDVRVAWRIAGAADGEVIAVLGGISAGRTVYSTATEQGWWNEVVGPGRALDAGRYRILGIDFLGGSGATTGPISGQPGFPSVSAFDQAAVLAILLRRLGIEKLHAIVGASYGGMVALAFAERHPELVGRIVAISAAHRSHPMATAWRSVQREIVRTLGKHGDAATGLKLARALAMATYRSTREFEQRFSGSPVKKGGVFRAPVEDYLYARGQSYADSYVPEAFVCLSESIDLHTIEPEKILVPTTLVAVREDQLVPLADMQALDARLAGQHRLIEISSLYGHDAFLKEVATLKKVFAESL